MVEKVLPSREKTRFSAKGCLTFGLITLACCCAGSTVVTKIANLEIGYIHEPTNAGDPPRDLAYIVNECFWENYTQGIWTGGDSVKFIGLPFKVGDTSLSLALETNPGEPCR